MPTWRAAPLLLLLVFLPAALGGGADVEEFNRGSFPADFVFGTGSAAYQYEGGWNTDGKGPSIWDTFTHQHPEKIMGHGNGDVAVDSYHRYKDDVESVKYMNMDAYRFSISWSRILPSGTVSDGVNKLGVEYYNNLIDELLSHGLKPFVTIFHWDVPQGLEDKYMGFLSPNIVEDYVAYADLAFKLFGDRVKQWVTFNEPYSFCSRAYALGTFAPGRCSSYVANCSAGNSATEPYICGHNILLAHAAAVNLYRQKYAEKQKGSIGITLVTNWFLPYSPSNMNLKAAQRALDFMFGWFMDPIASGEYPSSMRLIVGRRLPRFTRQESELLKGSFDFLGVNYYTTNYAEGLPPSSNSAINKSYMTDSQTNMTGSRNGVPLAPVAASDWLYIYPRGIGDLMLHIKNKYGNPIVYITENGVDEDTSKARTIEEAVDDKIRVNYHREHLRYLASAISRGARVHGYFAWSLADDFEWDAGFTVGFGLNYVDKDNGYKRIPKKSARWFRQFLSRQLYH